eukprot:NODE_2269_length_955_cov_12.626932_g1870_i0.p2 GENE.NODE_2269_length_955_cov_12.626932_g1870_i0~~NODE_2269_length_955_cov_12.626932_g1870_i0.p2  ORF type:complete len:150 (+),score=44.04 NODE_2269_length_955_cov_12.626932_g1870_i0:251-700(+)
MNLVRSDLLFDCGYSLSPLMDIGQIEGGFVQGLGYYLFEELKYDDQGKQLTDSTWTLSPPGPLDIPSTINIELLANSPNVNGVLSSKATGEPPLLASGSGLFACEDAVQQSLKERGKLAPSQYATLRAPATPQQIQGLAATSYSEFLFQ